MSNELGDFLRARRAAVRPDALGVHAGGRRRVAGLRREEVSAAAGISVDYYTRLEQGRETHPSDAVLDALARALGLGPDGAEHLNRLRGALITPTSASRGPGTRGEHGAASDGAVAPPEGSAPRADRMTALVGAVRPNPAYVLDRLSNMVAANPEGLVLYDGFASLPPEQRNTCRYLLTDPRARDTFVEWEQIARGAVAQLRAANAGDLRDAGLSALVAELSAVSDPFAEWWAQHLVARRRAAVTHVRTASGIVARRYEVLHLPEDGLRMTLWLPGEPAPAFA